MASKKEKIVIDEAVVTCSDVEDVVACSDGEACGYDKCESVNDVIVDESNVPTDGGSCQAEVCLPEMSIPVTAPESKHWTSVDDVVRTFAMNVPTGCIVLTNVGITFIPTVQYNKDTDNFFKV